MHAFKYLFLGVTLLSGVELTTATETLLKEDFGSLINKGLSDFMDQFGKEKKAELGIEDLVEEQKLAKEQTLKLEQETAEKRRLEKAKQKIGEAELRERQEIFAIRGSRIDEVISRYKLMESISLTLGEVVKILDQLKVLYESRTYEHSVKAITDGTAERCIVLINAEQAYTTVYMETYNGGQLKPEKLLIQYCVYNGNLLLPLRKVMKEDVIESMEMHEELYGMPHPRWDEFAALRSWEDYPQEKIALLSSGIDTTIQHVQYLQNYNLTYGELLKILKKMEKIYTTEKKKLIDEYLMVIYDRSMESINMVKARMCSEAEANPTVWEKSIQDEFRRNNWIKYVREKIEEILKKKMENYRDLRGTSHSRWSEFFPK